MPEKRIIIICSDPRSGTSYYSSILRQTGMAGWPGEWLTRKNETAYRNLNNLPDPDFRTYLEHLVSTRSSENGVFSIKLMGYQLPGFLKRARADYDIPDSLPDAEVFRIVFGRCHFVHIFREDRISWAISLFKARQTGNWRSFPNYEPYDTEKAHYNFRGIKGELEANPEGRWETFFSENKIEPLSYSYEQLLTLKPKEIIRQLFEFMELPMGHSETVFDSWMTTKRNDRRSSQSWKSRFLEDLQLERDFENSPHNGMYAEFAKDIRVEYGRPFYRAALSSRLSLRLELTNPSSTTWTHRGGTDTTFQPYYAFTWTSLSGGDNSGEWVEFQEPLAIGKSSQDVAVVTPSVAGDYLLEVDIIRKNDGPVSAVTGARACVLVQLFDPLADASRFFKTSLASCQASIDWLGDIDVRKYPWIRHKELEWLYCIESSNGSTGFWFWMPDIGLLSTDPVLFPLFYIPGRELLIEYQGIENEQKQFLTLNGDVFTAPYMGFDIPHKRLYKDDSRSESK